MANTKISTVKDIRALVLEHERYRARCLNLVASENVVSANARKATVSDLAGRYATYGDDPSVRNYKGNRCMADLEIAILGLAKELFNAEFVDLRPLSGEMAVKSLFLGLTGAGDKVYESGPNDGGHGVGRRMMSANLFKNILDLRYLPMKGEQLDPDMGRLREIILAEKPKLIVFGRSRILFPEPIEQVRDAADQVGAIIAYDASHIMGLIAGKAFPNPLDQGADVVAGSTAKTLGAPQGGIIFTRKQAIYKQVRQGFYPALEANHHISRIPGIGVTLLEMLTFGQDYCHQILRNSQALGRALDTAGLGVLDRERGYSASHQVLVDVSQWGDGGVIATLLERANIILDGITLPKDNLTGGKTKSGIRLGTQEITRTGATEKDMPEIAAAMKRVIVDKEEPEKVAKDVEAVVSRFDEIRFSFDKGVRPYVSTEA